MGSSPVDNTRPHQGSSTELQPPSLYTADSQQVPSLSRLSALKTATPFPKGSSCFYLPLRLRAEAQWALPGRRRQHSAYLGVRWALPKSMLRTTPCCSGTQLGGHGNFKVHTWRFLSGIQAGWPFQELLLGQCPRAQIGDVTDKSPTKILGKESPER